MKWIFRIYNSPYVKGASFAILGSLILSIIMALSKTLSSDLPTSMIVFVRSLFGFIFFLPFFLKNKKKGFRN